MEAKPRPLLGSLLGLLLGIVTVALLWQLGVVPPNRLVLCGVLSVTIALVTIILTQRTVLVRKRFVLVMIVCGLVAGVAISGIPDAFATGSISEGCSAGGTSSLDSKTPGQTSITDPFDVTRTDTVKWNAGSTEVLTNWRGSLGVDVGGFKVTIWSASSAAEDLPTSLSGSADVASYLADIEGRTGIRLAGIYRMYGHLGADQRACDMTAYVRVQGEGPFSGTLNTALWVALGAVGLLIVIMAGVVRQSIARSARAAVGATTPEATAEPHAIRKRPEEPAQPAEGGRQKRSDAGTRSREERNKGARPSKGETSRDVRAGDDSHATEDALGAEAGAQRDDQAPVDDAGARGEAEAAQTHADGEVPPDMADPGAPTSPSDDPEAPPSTDGEDKPAGQSD